MMGGALTTLSMVINSSLGKKIGLMQSTCINYIVGLMGSLIVLLFLGSNLNISVEEIKDIPIYIFLGGLLGVIVVYSSNLIIPKIPVVYSALLLFIGQILAGIGIDFILFGNLEIKKILGAIIISAGIIYNSKLDKK